MDNKAHAKKKNISIAVKIAVGFFAVFFIITYFNQRIELDELKRDYASKVEKLEKTQAYVRKLENLLSSDFDDEYVERVAKDKLNLVLPDEIIFYNDIAG